ncbi:MULTISPECIES: ABC transporter substrate-binding protein [unclassified Fusibacter]|uniref:substrate-binding periplasmic protein n=1 Tax=unclassified Fusibacter TaxID=2624464 RepID=UPI00101311BE|nr:MULTISPECIES: transporter substrate-binding domain-containing protein [unclassified Fusibacter]MCK8058340.1 transporter substrate-binding domain-containing protein [Fusibacter sp. A2]NPE20923.1 transporter substrate-binding domain-containing protein [Fusibacter sp. A1]RXV63126.1 hypothetical protein DWB64_03740 [Fusibacter sp. A1]
MNRHNLKKIVVVLYCLLLVSIIYSIFRVEHKIKAKETQTYQIKTYFTDSDFSYSSWKLTDKLQFTTNEYPPYAYTENGQAKGISYEIMVAVLDDMGLDYEIQFTSWARAVHLLDQGRTFGVFPAAISADRVEDYVFSDLLIDDKRNQSLVYEFDPSKTAKSRMNRVDELSFFKVGAVMSYYYLPDLESKGIDIDLCVDEIECLTKLKDGKISYAVLDPKVADFYIDRVFSDFKDGFIKTDITISHETVGDGLMLSQNNNLRAEFVKSFNNTLEKLNQNGTIEAITLKYETHK